MNAKSLFITGLVILLFANIGVAEENYPIVRAKIGIQLLRNAESRQAKGYDRIAVGDRFRIYLIPEPDVSYVYVVYADQKTVRLLNTPKQVELSKNQVLALPSLEGMYRVNEDSSLMTITLICSATKLAELDPLLADEEYSVARWRELERKLSAQSAIELSSVPDTPWPLAGSVRGNHNFLEELHISSGKVLVVKHYEFRIQK